jgi:hypothetical protein
MDIAYPLTHSLTHRHTHNLLYSEILTVLDHNENA